MRYPVANSLRRSLLNRLAAPLSLLALMSGLIAYWLAWQYTEHMADRSLADLAIAISKQVQISGSESTATVPPLAQAICSDPVEGMTYRVSTGDTEIAGDRTLPLHGSDVRRVRNAYVFEAMHGSIAVRVAQVRVEQPSGNPMIVEVGQPVARRIIIALEFLAAIMVPLLLLLLAGWVIVWRVVNQQLDPLVHLADSLRRQTYASLRPVDDTSIPIEIWPLISALNMLLERLKTAFDAQRKFIADAAHQLRTPLTAIKLHAEQAATSHDPDQIDAAIHELRMAANRAVRLSNQLLSLSRAEPGEQAAHFVDVDMAALAFETGTEWVPRALARGVDLGFQRLDTASRHAPPGSSGATDMADIPGSPEHNPPLIVRGNQVLLHEVIANLIDNALKYASRVSASAQTHDIHDMGSARITLSVSQRVIDGRPVAEITVEDNGPGVPPAQQADLFKRFFRGDNQNRSDVESGAGLGLAIVHDIMALHHGSVHYEDAQGGGARFIVRVPLR